MRNEQDIVPICTLMIEVQPKNQLCHAGQIGNKNSDKLNIRNLKKLRADTLPKVT